MQKSNGKIYWYGAGSEILDESDASGNITDEYIFFGGKRIARRNVASGNIYYYVEDMLGSSRGIVQSGGTASCYDADFYPYGGEKATEGSARNPPRGRKAQAGRYVGAEAPTHKDRGGCAASGVVMARLKPCPGALFFERKASPLKR